MGPKIHQFANGSSIHARTSADCARGIQTMTAKIKQQFRGIVGSNDPEITQECLAQTLLEMEHIANKPGLVRMHLELVPTCICQDGCTDECCPVCIPGEEYQKVEVGALRLRLLEEFIKEWREAYVGHGSLCPQYVDEQGERGTGACCCGKDKLETLSESLSLLEVTEAPCN